jgi:hypothetical protein
MATFVVRYSSALLFSYDLLLLNASDDSLRCHLEINALDVSLILPCR